MSEMYIKVNPNIVEQIVQQRTANLQTELTRANEQLAELQAALEALVEGITEEGITE